jgi:type I restriction enzyme, S subunit
VDVNVNALNVAEPSIRFLPAADVRPGYKLTEIGIIPADWHIPSLDEISSFRTGPFGSALHKSDYVEGGIPLINPMHIVDGEIKPAASTTVTMHAARRLSAYRFRLQDIVIGRRGDMGRCAVIGDAEVGWLCGTGSLIIRCNGNVDASFIQRTLTTERVIRAIEDASVGSTMINLNQRSLARLQIPCPPIIEQHAIAEALSDMDELLGALKALIEKKRAIKQGAMQQLLTGKIRLPGFSGEWVTNSLEYVTDCLDKLRVPLNETERAQMPGSYPYCGANGVLDYVNSFVLDDDVILIAEDGGYFDEYAHRPIAYRMSGRIWVNNHAHILKAKPGYSQGFLYFSLVHKNLLPYLASGTRAKLKRSEMNKIEVLLPKEEVEQAAIAAVLSDVDAEIGALEACLHKTRAIKQGMMQQLLTGRIRLVKPQPAEAEA